MQTITITGGHPLRGSIQPAAAKNSTLPLLAATLLCGAPCRLPDIPPLADVDTSLALLQAVGAHAVRVGADICTAPADALCGEIPEHLAGAMRSSVFYLAPLLCRAGAGWGRAPSTFISPGWPPWARRSSSRASPSHCAVARRCTGRISR